MAEPTTKTANSSGFTPDPKQVTAVPFNSENQGVAVQIPNSQPTTVFIGASNAPKIEAHSLVKLKVLLVHNSNALYPGAYKALEIPKKYWTPDKVELVGGGSKVVSANDLELKRQKITLTTEPPPNQKNPYPNAPAVQVTRDLVPETPQDLAPAKIEVGKVNVNSATLAQLEGLENVGTATANKIIEERGKTPFSDVSDLTERITLRGGSWDALSTQLIFADPQAATQEQPQK